MAADFQDRITNAVEIVRQRIEDHQSGREAPFSVAVLANVLSELRIMQSNPDYDAGYPRFLLDWPDDSNLKTMLIDIAHLHSRSRRKI